MQTVKNIMHSSVKYLEDNGDEHPELSVEIILCNIINKSRPELYLSIDDSLSQDEIDKIDEAIKRRASGEPLQYITGSTAFRNIEVECAPGALIPRPETETLVEIALGIICDNAANVLEIGAGTGIIALSIASESEKAQVISTDISKNALKIANRNKERLGLCDRVRFIQSDIDSSIDRSLEHAFDIIVSNPPYIPSDVLQNQVGREVKDFEPTVALDGGYDGLDIFYKIEACAHRWLKPRGYICLELFEGNVEKAAKYLRGLGTWTDVEIIKDLTNRPRFFKAHLL